MQVDNRDKVGKNADAGPCAGASWGPQLDLAMAPPSLEDMLELDYEDDNKDSSELLISKDDEEGGKIESDTRPGGFEPEDGCAVQGLTTIWRMDCAPSDCGESVDALPPHCGRSVRIKRNARCRSASRCGRARTCLAARPPVRISDTPSSYQLNNGPR